MARQALIDSGPLIALFDKDDRHHERAIEFVRGFVGRFVANLAVVTEVAYLLDFSLQAQTDFLQWVRNGGVTLLELEPADFEPIMQLMRKYADRPMDFTDATLVAVAERLDIRDVVSIDQDFAIYRFRNRSAFRNLFPNVARN